MSNQDDFQPPYLRSAAGSGDYEETKTNPHGFFHDTKSAVSVFEYLPLCEGCLFSKSSTESKTFGGKRAIWIP